MSFKARIAAGAATAALVGGGLGLAGVVSASASTPSCGACADLYTLKFNQGNTPSFVLDTYHGSATKNQEIIQFQASNSDPAEDFVITDEGTVNDYYNSHGNGSLFTSAFRENYRNDAVYQFEYEPYGNSTDLCVGTWEGEVAQAGYKVRLEPCGQTTALWVLDSTDGTTTEHNAGEFAFIAGTNENFSDPMVLNYPVGYPTDMPRPWLNVQPLQHYSDKEIYNNQLWESTAGFGG